MSDPGGRPHPHPVPAPEVSAAFGLDPAGVSVAPLGGGHVHRTYVLRPSVGEALVVQALNPAAAGDPMALARRTIEVLGALATVPDPDLVDLEPRRGAEGEPCVVDSGGVVWRAFVLIDGSDSADRAARRPSPGRAAELFGRFSTRATRAGIAPAGRAPFHDLGRRVDEYHRARAESDRTLGGVGERLDAALAQVSDAGALPRRVVHNDAKPANLLVDVASGEALAIIDLDVVGEGTIVADLGDLVRSQSFVDGRLSPDTVVEVTEGYLRGLGGGLSRVETTAVPVAGEIVTAELAVRRATDALSGAGYFADADHAENLRQIEAQLARLDQLVAARTHLVPRLEALVSS